MQKPKPELEPVKTMKQLQERNKISGRYWFSPDTMRFFDSRIETELFCFGKIGYFLSSEQMDSETPRYYSVRKADLITGEIETKKTEDNFKSKKDAMKELRSLGGEV